MNQKNLTAYIVVAIIGVVGLLTIAGIIYSNINNQKNSSENSDTSTQTTSTPTQTLTSTPTESSTNATTAPTSTSSTLFKNGTFTANQGYVVEGHNESISVSLTISGDKITGITNTYSGNEPQSQQYQGSFESQIKSQVVGKKLSEISTLSRVGGASFTTRAFNQALTSIKSEAAV